MSYISVEPEKVFCHMRSFRKMHLCIRSWIHVLHWLLTVFKLHHSPSPLSPTAGQTDKKVWTLLPLAQTRSLYYAIHGILRGKSCSDPTQEYNPISVSCSNSLKLFFRPTWEPFLPSPESLIRWVIKLLALLVLMFQPNFQCSSIPSLHSTSLST